MKTSSVNRQQALREAAASLQKHDVADARAEAEVLLAHSLGINRSQLYATLSDPMPEAVLHEYRGLLARRAAGEPSAYVTQRREFFGLEFYVDPRVLIPRPETELLVEKVLDLGRTRYAGRPLRVADIGTGSGAIAIAIAVNLPDAEIYAADASPEALEVAAINCTKHGVAGRVHLLQGDLLSPLPGRVDLLVANLPYIRDGDYASLPRHVREHEPASALLAGRQGLDFIFKLLEQAAAKISPDGTILLEIGAGQARAVAARARALFPGAKIEILKDLASLDRVIVLSLRVLQRRTKQSRGG